MHLAAVHERPPEAATPDIVMPTVDESALVAAPVSLTALGRTALARHSLDVQRDRTRTDAAGRRPTSRNARNQSLDDRTQSNDMMILPGLDHGFHDAIAAFDVDRRDASTLAIGTSGTS